MHAVIRTGGKQYLVAAGTELKIEKLDIEAGKPVTFDEVLLVAGPEVSVGTPLVKGAVVAGTVVAHGRSAKVTSIKFHNKVRYRRKIGHRQHWTKVKIEKITV